MNNTTNYHFSDKEKLYFDRLQQAFQQGVGAGIQMIVTQQDLPGQWRIKSDGSGIERVDPPPPDALVPVSLLPDSPLSGLKAHQAQTLKDLEEAKKFTDGLA